MAAEHEYWWVCTKCAWTKPVKDAHEVCSGPFPMVSGYRYHAAEKSYGFNLCGPLRRKRHPADAVTKLGNVVKETP